MYDLVARRAAQITHDHRSLSPIWGPRGIAFSRGPDVWLTRPDGTGTRRLTHTHVGIVPAAWSRDGRHLLGSGGGWTPRLWAIDLPSGRARDLTGPVSNIVPQGLSRDGRTVLAAIGCGHPLQLAAGGTIETIPFAGGRPHVISKGGCRASWNR